MLRDVSELDTKVSLLGEEVAFPICVSPMGQQCVVHPEGEAATARGMHHVTDEISQSPTHPSIYSSLYALLCLQYIFHCNWPPPPPACANLGTCMTLSTWSSTNMDDVAMANGSGLRWYQLYAFKDRGMTTSMIQRAERAGYKALVVTVDVLRVGKQLPVTRKHFRVPSHRSFSNFSEHLQSSFNIKENVHSLTTTVMDPSSTWDDIDWICSVTKLPVLLKGILTSEDAVEAVKHNIRGIIVSNHGGRKLDGVPATVSLFQLATSYSWNTPPHRLMSSVRWWRL